MSIASRIEQIEQHIENAYESIGNKGVDLRDKLNIDLKGNTSQEVISGEVGLEVEDTSIYVDDVNEDKENYITLKGNTYQETTTGKNLFNATQFLANDYWNSQYFQKGSNQNTLIVNSANTQQWSELSLIFANKIISGHNYYFSCEGASRIELNNATNINISGTTATFTANEEGIKIKIFASSYPSTITKLLLIDTSVYNDTSYEPYTNGASPNPDYPQEIEVVTGNNVVKVEGKNLFDIEQYSFTNGMAYSSGNSVYWSGYQAITNYFPVKPNTQYTFSNELNKPIYYGLVYYDKDKNKISYINENTTTFTTPNNCEYIRFAIQSDTAPTNVQIEKGQATTYEAYQGASYPVNLGSIELCKIGNYQDRIYKSLVDGNWYLHKEITKQRINSTGGSIESNGFRNDGNFSTDLKPATAYPVLYSKYFGYGASYNDSVNANGNTPNKLGLNTSGQVLCNISGYTTAQQYVTYFTNNDVYVYYPLFTPTDTQITDTTLVSQLEALYQAQIHSTTHINTETSNLLPYIDLKYNVVTASPSPERASEVEVVTGNNVIYVMTENLSNGINQNYWINSSAINSGKADGNSGLAISVDGLSKYTISTKTSQTRYRVACSNTLPDSTINIYNGQNKDNTSDTITIDTKGYNYLIINATDLSSIYVVKGASSKLQTYNITLGNLELCKIGNYQDYFYKDNGNWYKHSEVGKVVFDGTEYWEGGSSATVSTNYTYVYTQAIDNLAKTGIYTCFNNKFDTLNGPMLIDTSVNTDTLSCGSSGYNRVRIMILTSRLSSANVNGFKSWLSNNNVTLYYVLTTPTQTQITDTILINQLNALADARKYEDGIETIINQTNSDLSFEIETNPTHLNRNIENISTEIDKIETTEWKPQLDWWDIDTILANDTEDYPCKIIALLRNIESTTTIDRLNSNKIKTSDGVEYSTSANSYSHTWDTTKDKPCSLGYKTRYIIWYFSSNNIDNYNKYVPDSSLYIIAKNINTNRNFNAFSKLSICECIKLTNCYFNGAYLFFNQNRNMKKLTGVNSGASNLSGSGSGTFASCFSLKELELQCNNTVSYNIRDTFSNCNVLKTMENLDLESMGIKPSLVKSYWGFGNSAIKTIREINFDNIETSNSNNWTTAFQNLFSLIEIETIGQISLSGINISYCVLLNHDTLLRFLNALYDYSSSSDTYTLTLGNTNLAKLTAQEIQIGTDKGWTIN